jgi:uncharacterized protein (TIGR00369 family)
MSVQRVPPVHACLRTGMRPRAENGEVEIRLPWRQELWQCSGFLHAGVIGALIDTVCGFAAAAVTGQRLLASHYSVNCLSPAIGSTFFARGKVIKAGKRQIFTSAACQAAGAERQLCRSSRRRPGGRRRRLPS